MVIEGQWGREKAVSDARDDWWFVIVPVVSEDCRSFSSSLGSTERFPPASVFEVVNVPTVGVSGASCCVVVLSSRTLFVLTSS